MFCRICCIFFVLCFASTLSLVLHLLCSVSASVVAVCVLVFIAIAAIFSGVDAIHPLRNSPHGERTFQALFERSEELLPPSAITRQGTAFHIDVHHVDVQGTFHVAFTGAPVAQVLSLDVADGLAFVHCAAPSASGPTIQLILECTSEAAAADVRSNVPIGSVVTGSTSTWPALQFCQSDTANAHAGVYGRVLSAERTGAQVVVVARRTDLRSVVPDLTFSAQFVPHNSNNNNATTVNDRRRSCRAQSPPSFKCSDRQLLSVPIVLTKQLFDLSKPDTRNLHSFN